MVLLLTQTQMKSLPQGSGGVLHVPALSIRLQESGGDLLRVSGGNICGNKAKKVPMCAEDSKADTFSCT